MDWTQDRHTLTALSATYVEFIDSVEQQTIIKLVKLHKRLMNVGMKGRLYG